MTLRDLIEQGLARHDLLRQDLADHLQVSPASISKWLRTDRPTPVPWRHWRGVCAFCRIPWATWLRIAQREVPASVVLYQRYIDRPSRQSGHGA